MPNHTGQGQIIEAQSITQNEEGNWVPATPESYHPSLLEKFAHFFGMHQWTWTVHPDETGTLVITKEPADDAHCVMCGIKYK